MNREFVNTDPLIGRHFVTASGNVATVERIRPGIIGIRWSRDPHSRQDEIECEDWGKKIIESIEGPIEIVSSGEDRETLDQALARWRRSEDD